MKVWRFNLTQCCNESELEEIPPCPFCGWKHPEIQIRTFGVLESKRTPHDVVELNCRNPDCFLHNWNAEFLSVGDALMHWSKRTNILTPKNTKEHNNDR